MTSEVAKDINEHYLVTERSFTIACSVRALHLKRINEEFICLFISFYPVIRKKVAFSSKKLNTLKKCEVI